MVTLLYQLWIGGLVHGDSRNTGQYSPGYGGWHMVTLEIQVNTALDMGAGTG